MPTIQKDMLKKLTKHAKNSFAEAAKIAVKCGKKEVLPEHLFLAILDESGSVGSTILSNIGIDKAYCEKVIFTKEPLKTSAYNNTFPISKKLSAILTNAFASAADFQYPYVGTEHITYALLETPSTTISKILKHSEKLKAKKNSKKSNTEKHPNPMPNALAHIGNMLGLEDENDLENSAISQFTTDPTNTRDKNPFIGNSKTIFRIITILGRRTKNNPILVGEPGIGKTALIEHLANLCNSPEAPSHLHGKNILTLDLTLLIAGTSFRGEFEQRLKDIITETEKRNDVILFIDELHTIMGAGNTGGTLDAANILKPALARGKLSVIGATTFEEYKKHIEKDMALARRFQKVIMNEPTLEETYTILRDSKKVYESHHNVSFTKEAIQSIVELSARYLPEQRMPDKAFDILDETASRMTSSDKATDEQIKLHNLEKLLNDLIEQKNELIYNKNFDEAINIQKQENLTISKLRELQKKLSTSSTKKHIINKNDVAKTVSDITGTPYEAIISTPTSKIAKSLSILKRHIVGQDSVLSAVTDTLLRSATGISKDSRPQGSFLFLGPTGVGKTLTAQVLAKEIFHSEDSLIKIDMSELMERHSSSKLLGAPAGYIGYGDGGTLTEKVRKKPYSVVLFDEIEKAHPDIFNLLLQILEDGKITDSEGRTIDFRNCIIIMTSNAGTSNMDKLGFDNSNDSKEKLDSSLKELFPKELLSRIDNICYFNKLDTPSLLNIAKKEVKDLEKRLKRKNIILSIDKSLFDYIIDSTKKETSNARTIRKFIQDNIESKLAEYFLKNPEISKLKLSKGKNEIKITQK